MSRLKLFAVLATMVLTSGCAGSFETDGTAESEIVRKWLSPSWLASQSSDSLIEPQARLVMSDYEVPLTRRNLRRLGPDRRSGCERSTLRREEHTVVGTWSCPTGTDLAFRTVYFQVRAGRIAAASHTEAYQAVALPTG